METFFLGMSETAFGAIQNGEATRRGGVVYWNTGGILEHLTDADIQNGSDEVKELCGTNVVPFAVLGVSMLAINNRLEKIEATLRQMQLVINKILARAELSNLQATGNLIGHLRGTLHACHLDIQEGRRERLVEYRRSLLESYYIFKEIVDGIAGNPELVRESIEIFNKYSQFMFLAGVAARDVTYRMGKKNSARDLADEFAEHAIGLERSLRMTLSQPSALFWRNDQHISVALEIRESTARLSSQAESLRLLSNKEVRILIAKQKS